MHGIASVEELAEALSNVKVILYDEQLAQLYAAFPKANARAVDQRGFDFAALASALYPLEQTGVPDGWTRTVDGSLREETVRDKATFAKSGNGQLTRRADKLRMQKPGVAAWPFACAGATLEITRNAHSATLEQRRRGGKKQLPWRGAGYGPETTSGGFTSATTRAPARQRAPLVAETAEDRRTRTLGLTADKAATMLGEKSVFNSAAAAAAAKAAAAARKSKGPRHGRRKWTPNAHERSSCYAASVTKPWQDMQASRRLR
jgi:hypothetical protein